MDISFPMLLGGGVLIYAWVVWSRGNVNRTSTPKTSIAGIQTDSDTLTHKESTLSFNCTQGNASACAEFRQYYNFVSPVNTNLE